MKLSRLDDYMLDTKLDVRLHDARSVLVTSHWWFPMETSSRFSPLPLGHPPNLH
jgi:hypothetical protein